MGAAAALCRRMLRRVCPPLRPASRPSPLDPRRCAHGLGSAKALKYAISGPGRDLACVQASIRARPAPARACGRRRRMPQAIPAGATDAWTDAGSARNWPLAAPRPDAHAAPWRGRRQGARACLRRPASRIHGTRALRGGCAQVRGHITPPIAQMSLPRVEASTWTRGTALAHAQLGLGAFLGAGNSGARNCPGMPGGRTHRHP